jgi:hypothetical protein
MTIAQTMKCTCDLPQCKHKPNECKGNGTGGRMATKQVLCEYCFYGWSKMLKAEFKIVPHLVRENCDIVEVWYNGRFMATITPGDPGTPSIHVVSNKIAHRQEITIHDDLPDVFVFTFAVHP